MSGGVVKRPYGLAHGLFARGCCSYFRSQAVYGYSQSFEGAPRSHNIHLYLSTVCGFKSVALKQARDTSDYYANFYTTTIVIASAHISNCT